MDLSRRAHGIATSYEDAKVRTHLLNALPDMFTFLSYPGMPPHNNDTERAIRDGIIPQRNSRHKTMNARGRKTLSMLLIRPYLRQTRRLAWQGAVGMSA